MLKTTKKPTGNPSRSLPLLVNFLHPSDWGLRGVQIPQDLHSLRGGSSQQKMAFSGIVFPNIIVSPLYSTPKDNCADDHDIGEVKQHIASMESSIRTLNQQEKKYAAELDAALTQYAELQQQASDMDVVELNTARHAIRSIDTPQS